MGASYPLATHSWLESGIYSTVALRLTVARKAIPSATEPMDMRAGIETALAIMIAAFGAAKPHCAYLFANRRATLMKVLVHSCFGIWLADRRLNQGRCLSATMAPLFSAGARVHWARHYRGKLCCPSREDQSRPPGPSPTQPKLQLYRDLPPYHRRQPLRHQ